ncbi:type II toxin-antitoxin system Phd/YefM family antitoxin [Yinghuangia seranimata]|uniref:type II toxin-antitoxin system Phd/YefM family antitoxin n=1 Tax=Yinghuangia seranimata TaxID=408067 RepID=UPI00248C4D4E|nr:type II toxin-antitoxin system Phd/YefM family antitoxin [Yinghuangia seranimata]MDI2130350.1 type II toxin-antitoxin system Phd/YefM family antitoxin [Yinghuangia seranimata]
MKTLSLANAKTQLSSVVDEVVRTHEQVTVTRNGEPAVVILAVEDFEAIQETIELLADGPARARIEQARSDIAVGEFSTADELADLMAERRRRGE